MQLEYIRLGDNIDRYLYNLKTPEIHKSFKGKTYHTYEFKSQSSFLNFKANWLRVNAFESGVIFIIEFRGAYTTPDECSNFVESAIKYYGLEPILNTFTYISDKGYSGIYTLNHTINANQTHNGYLRIEIENR